MEKWLHIDVTHHEAERRARLSLRGQLDVLSAPELITSIIGILRHVTTVELDLAALTYLDAAGVRCLLTCHGAAADAGLSLKLVCPSPQVALVLEVTGLLGMVADPEP